MANINLENVSVNIPVFDIKALSIRGEIKNQILGGFLTKSESNKVTVEALKDINLHCENGDRVGIIGHNGCGKTTLLRVMSGVYYPTKGKVDIVGKVSTMIDITIGMMIDSTGLENIYIRGQLLGFEKKYIDKNLDEIIEFTELGEFIKLPVRTYSSGMQMRLAFGIMSILNTDILILDEWISVGDASFQLKAEKKMMNLVDKTKIVVIASHSIDLIKKLCNKVLILNSGKLEKYGETKEILL